MSRWTGAWACRLASSPTSWRTGRSGLCLGDSFQQAGQSLECLLGLQVGVRSLERMNRALAEDAEPFRDEQPTPPAAEEAAVLVFTADGKGVPMRRPLEKRVRGHQRRAKGEKANKKQMAYVGAVYSLRLRRSG